MANPLERNDSFFSAMQGPDATQIREEKDAERQENYEAKFVLRFFQEAGVRLGRGVLEAQAKADTGESQLTFAWFRSRYPQFPVVLYAEKLRYVHEVTIADLFLRFTKLKFLTVFEEKVRADGLDLRTRNAGLIFEWPGIGTVVLHNLRRNSQIGNDDSFYDGGTLVVRSVGAPPITYVIETLKTFIPAVGRDWRE